MEEVNRENSCAHLSSKKISNRNTARLKCINLLKEIGSFTFLIKDEDLLLSLADDLGETLEKVQVVAAKGNGKHLKLPSPCKAKKRSMRKTDDPISKKKRKTSSQNARKHPCIPDSSSTEKPVVTTTIDLTEPDQPVSSHIINISNSWVGISTINLTKQDKIDLLSGENLNDKHIHAAQLLLKEQFPNLGGLVDPVLLSSNLASNVPTQNTSLQIHHVPGHWLMSYSSERGNINIYNSIKNTVLTPSLLQQLNIVYEDKSPEHITVRCCQEQAGVNDCGLYAIANSVALANGIDLDKIKFHQPMMRIHLKVCLESNYISLFPHQNVDFNSTATDNIDTVQYR